MILVFDLDGTLIDTSARIHAVYREVVSGLGGRPLDRDTFWLLKRRNTGHEGILGRSGLGARHKQEFLDRFISLVELPENLRLDTVLPGALKAIEDPALAAHERFLVTLRRSEQAVRQELSALGLDRHFAPSRVLTGHTEGDGYLKKVDLIRDRVLPQASGAAQVAVIGDTEADIKAAQTLTGDGWNAVAVGVTSGIRDGEYLAALRPDYLIGSVVELPPLIQRIQARPVRAARPASVERPGPA